MKNIYLITLTFLITWSLNAQITCEDPLVLIDDDIEGYATGDVTMQSADWDVWPSFEAGGMVSTDVASAGSQSVKIDGSIESQDVLLLLGDKTEGHYIISWDMYVSDSTNAYFNLQQQMPTATEGFWGFDVFFEEGEGRLELYDGTGPTAFNYPENAWFTLFILADLDNGQARLIVNEKTVDSWQYSTGSTPGLQSLNSINFFPIDESYVYYVDNVNFREIPAAETGQYCYTAEVVEAPGFLTVPGLSCYGAGYDLTGGNGAFGGYWYAFTPEQDGILSISSCGGGVDTRGWIFSGEDCRSLQTVGVNDDRCDQGDGNDWASYREAVATAGTTYYIMWDNVWEADGFTFELALDTQTEPEPGEFCQSAIPIEPGEFTIEEITGEAAVGGPNINNTVASITSYTQSKWYAFTPPADGLMSISSCEFAASDTYFFVYTGDCSSFEGLALVAENDDGCFDGDELQVMAALDSIELEGGATYYIEWIDRRIEQEGSAELYIWTMEFEPTEPVNVREEELAQRVEVFPNPAHGLLNLRYDFSETVTEMNIRLTDMLGRTLRQERLTNIQAGAREINVQALPAGTYFLQLSADGVIHSRPVVVVR